LRLILLSPADNCLIAAARLAAGTQVEIEGERVTLVKTIELGHKVARHELAKDDKVLRYGAVIGHVTAQPRKRLSAHLHPRRGPRVRPSLTGAHLRGSMPRWNDHD
jgi:altronate dehydratase small subunit